MPLHTNTARMDLTFSLAERFTESGQRAGIAVTAEYRTDVFDGRTVEGLIERLQRLLTAVTADPQRRLSAVDLLDANEHARLEKWGNTAVLARPATRCRCPTGSPRRRRAPRRGRADLRRPVHDLPRTRRSG